MERKGDWMQTYTGRQFWPIDPRPDEVLIDDIGHALANQCRYAGHCKVFYSVAQHSVLVSKLVPKDDALWGLLHDAAEAYLVDLPRPVKRFSDLGTRYREIEAQLTGVICEHFCLQHVEPQSVKKADDVILVTEMRDLMAHPPQRWKESWSNEPLAETIVPLTPFQSELAFMERYHELVG